MSDSFKALSRISDRYSHFIHPENARKANIFSCFQGVIKDEYWPEMA